MSNTAQDNGATFDRFDICEAYWCYAALYHGGQWSPEYAYLGRLSNLGFFPGVNCDDPNNMTENCRIIFDALVHDGGHEPYDCDD